MLAAPGPEETAEDRLIVREVRNHPGARFLRGDELEDLTQECRIHWWLAQDRYDPARGASRETYLKRVVSNRVTSLLRQRHPEAASLDAAITAHEDRRLADLLEDESLVPVEETAGASYLVHRASLQLSLRQREVLRLLLDDYAVADIAELLHVSRDTANEDRRRIRKSFEDQGLKPRSDRSSSRRV